MGGDAIKKIWVGAILFLHGGEQQNIFKRYKKFENPKKYLFQKLVKKTNKKTKCHIRYLK